LETGATTPSSGGADQYWTVAPPAPVYAAVDASVSPAAAAAAAATYFSPMFFQVRSAATSEPNYYRSGAQLATWPNQLTWSQVY